MTISGYLLPPVSWKAATLPTDVDLGFDPGTLPGGFLLYWEDQGSLHYWDALGVTWRTVQAT